MDVDETASALSELVVFFVVVFLVVAVVELVFVVAFLVEAVVELVLVEVFADEALIASFWPVVIESLDKLFHFLIWLTVTPYLELIAHSVSPDLTVYVVFEVVVLAVDVDDNFVVFAAAALALVVVFAVVFVVPGNVIFCPAKIRSLVM